MQNCCACTEPGGPQGEWDGEDGEIDKDLCMWNFRGHDGELWILFYMKRK